MKEKNENIINRPYPFVLSRMKLGAICSTGEAVPILHYICFTRSVLPAFIKLV